jgi:flagellar hook-associated protein 1 FlgK
MAADLLGIAVSGLKTSQTQIATTGHNITNANQEGYSRQRVDLGVNTAQFVGAGYIGTGAHVQSIERLANEFLTSQIRLDTTSFNEIDAFSQKIGEIDNLLSNESVGLSSGLSDFFGALQAATDDPTSIPVRQLILAQSEVLAQRFSGLNARFSETNDIINQELDATASLVSSLASSIAALNEAVVNATAQSAGSPPNDLLDERDETLRQLSELVSVTTFGQGDGAVNVFIGNGQPLVVGQISTRVEAIVGQTDPTRYDLAFFNEGNVQVVTEQISGGRLGGLLNYRDEVLDRSFNELGRIALVLVQTINEQQSIGLDLNGNFGVPLFDEINLRQSTLDRVVPSRNNQPPLDRVVSVEITDASNLSNSDYTLSFSGSGPSAFELRRDSDDAVVFAGGLPAQRPTSIEFGGFKINVEEGTFQDGDRFQIMPARTAGSNVTVTATSPEVLAFALPISTANSLANSGTGKISLGDVIQTIDPLTGEYLPAFENLGELSPPLMVRFTSATTYDVMDVSDPSNPKSLQPPIENQAFIPGQTNQIFPSEPGQTIVTSQGHNSNRIPNQSEVVNGVLGTSVLNTILDESLSLSYTDPLTGFVSTQPNLLVNEGDSAENIAFQLSNRQGIKATASTHAEIRVVDNSDINQADFNLHLNGINLRDELAHKLSPAPVPIPITNDLIAEAINYSSALQSMNISAVSDGNSIKVTAKTGADLKFEVQGSTADFVEIKGDEVATLMTTRDVVDGVDLSAAGPNQFNIDLFDGPAGLSNPKTISIEGTFNNANELMGYLRNQINIAYEVPGKVSIELRDDGTLEFKSSDSSMASKLQISGVGQGDPLGLAAAQQQGAVAPGDVVKLSGPYEYPTVYTSKTFTGGVSFSAGASVELDLFDGPGDASNPVTVALAGTYSTSASVVSYLQSQVNAAYGANDKVLVQLQANGTVGFVNIDDSPVAITEPTIDGTLGSYASADMGIISNTVINAANDTFSLAVDGRGLLPLTLSTTFDAGSGPGQYDNAAQLALAINDAIANNANFSSGDGSGDDRTVVAGANGNGGITFTSLSGGERSLVSAVSGTFVIPTANISVDGVAEGGPFGRSVIDFGFDGILPIAATGFSVDVAINGAAAVNVTVADGNYTTAASFAAALTAGGLGALNATATVSADGSQVFITSDNAAETLTVAVSAGTLQTNAQNTYIQHSNGDAVIIDVANFITDLDNTDFISLDVNAAGPQDIQLDYSAAGYGVAYPPGGKPTNATELANLINYTADITIAGSGINATVDGSGQVVIAPKVAGGSVVVEIAQANPVITATLANIATTDLGLVGIPPGTPGTVTTGSFNVDTGGDFIDSAGDLDPMQIRVGVNDEFELSINGGASYLSFTIAPNTYNSLADLATAISASVAGTATVNVVNDSLEFTDNATGATSQLLLRDETFAISGAAVDGSGTGDRIYSTSSAIQINSFTGSDDLGLAAAVQGGIVTADGYGTVNSVALSGQLSVELEEGFSLSSNSIKAGNFFKPEPESFSKFFGYTFDISGNPDVGDEFTVGFNTDGVSDNRNALKFIEIESAQLIGGNTSFHESYGNLIEFIGTLASEANVNKIASSEILGQSRELRNSISGVNLDEEAANLIRFELSYNAASRVISVARDLFDTLLAAF